MILAIIDYYPIISGIVSLYIIRNHSYSQLIKAYYLYRCLREIKVIFMMCCSLFESIDERLDVLFS
jgi:hypothetical protein